jgi:hypothetical protein
MGAFKNSDSQTWKQKLPLKNLGQYFKTLENNHQSRGRLHSKHSTNHPLRGLNELAEKCTDCSMLLKTVKGRLFIYSKNRGKQAKHKRGMPNRDLISCRPIAFLICLVKLVEIFNKK